MLCRVQWRGIKFQGTQAQWNLSRGQEVKRSRECLYGKGSHNITEGQTSSCVLWQFFYRSCNFTAPARRHARHAAIVIVGVWPRLTERYHTKIIGTTKLGRMERQNGKVTATDNKSCSRRPTSAAGRVPSMLQSLCGQRWCVDRGDQNRGIIDAAYYRCRTKFRKFYMYILYQHMPSHFDCSWPSWKLLSNEHWVTSQCDGRRGRCHVCGRTPLWFCQDCNKWFCHTTLGNVYSVLRYMYL